MAETAAVTAAKAEQAAKRKASKLAAAALPCLCPPACACHAVGAHRRGDDVNDIAASRAKEPYGTGKPPPGGRCYRCRNKSAAASRVANYIPVKKPPRLSAVFSSPPAGGVQEESGIQYASRSGYDKAPFIAYQKCPFVHSPFRIKFEARRADLARP